MKHIIAHYHEIALKGKNRPFFVNKLLDNLRDATKGTGVDNAKDQGGRVILSLASDAREDLVKDRVSKVFGIANFAFGYRTSNDVEVLKEAVLRHIKDNAFKSFRVSTKRGYKEYPLTSMDVDRIIGGHVKGAPGAKGDFTHPELTVFIEVLSKEAFFYTQKFQGQGGLPVGTGGKAACPPSGGAASPG